MQRAVGLRLVVGYKLAKGTLVLALAVALTFARADARDALGVIVRELSEGGATMRRIAASLAGRAGVLLGDARVLAWVDGVTTLAEGVLLATGRPWAEDVVLLSLTAFLVAEVVALERAPSWPKALVLLANGAIVLWLAHRRARARRRQPSRA